MHKPSFLSRNSRLPLSDLLALIAYFLLTMLMTWPTVLHLAGGIPGDGFDGWQNYWNLWWVKKALLILGTNPYFTDYLYPPDGTNLLFHTLNIFNSLWALPIQLNFGLAIAYNSIVFFSFVFSGYGGYLLSLHVLTRLNLPGNKGQRLAAFVGGLIFTMSPFHMAHLLGHMQVFSMMWPPFYILSLLRTLESRDTSSRYFRHQVALTGLFLILATLVDWYHTLYLLIFTGLVLVWTTWQQWQALSEQKSKGEGRQRRNFPPAPPLLCSSAGLTLLRPFWIIMTIGLGFALLLSPLLVPMIREASARPDLQTGLAQNVTLSADLLAFITPSEMHPLWGQWARNIADNFSSPTSERLIFAGFVPLALSLVAVVRGWQKSIVKFWTLVVFTFFVLAVGPYLHIGGKIVRIGHWPIPMPYLLLYNTIPFIDLTRSLGRYDLMVMLGLGVLAAIALASITNPPGKKNCQSLITSVKWQVAGGRWQVLRITHHASRITHLTSHIPYLPTPYSLLATLLICFEFLPIPYPISQIDIPSFYFDIAAEPADYTIAELPMNWDRPTPLLHQTIHGKRLLTAYTSRNNPRELAWRTPVFQQWRYLAPDIIDQPLAASAPTIFYDFNLRYIVLDYWQMPPGPEREATEKWVAAALPDTAPIYDDGRLKVYPSPPRQETQPYLTLGDGWSERQENEGRPVFRSFPAAGANQAELFLHHPQEQSLVLEITAAAPVPQNLTLLADSKPVSEFQVAKTFSTQRVTLPPSTGNVVRLCLRSENPAGKVSAYRIGLGASK